MAKLKTALWTLVAHNGLPNAVMATTLSTDSQVAKVKEVGGLLFDDYLKADAAEYQANYPNEVEAGLYPRAGSAGTFSRKTIDGDRIYIPQGVQS